MKRDGYCRPGTKLPGNYPPRIRGASLIDTQEGSGGMFGLGSTGVAFDTHEGAWVAKSRLHRASDPDEERSSAASSETTWLNKSALTRAPSTPRAFDDVGAGERVVR